MDHASELVDINQLERNLAELNLVDINQLERNLEELNEEAAFTPPYEKIERVGKIIDQLKSFSPRGQEEQKKVREITERAGQLKKQYEEERQFNRAPMYRMNLSDGDGRCVRVDEEEEFSNLFEDDWPR